MLRKRVADHGWEGLGPDATVDGLALGQWIRARRRQYLRGELPERLTKELEAIAGWTWTPRITKQQRALALLRDYVARHGWAGLIHANVIIDGVNLSGFVASRRWRHRHGRFISLWVVEELESIPGWQWNPIEEAHRDMLARLQRLIDAHSDTADNVVNEIAALTRWIRLLRKRRKQGRLSGALQQQIQSIPGWRW